MFYAQTDWLRLATKLAQNASPCAQYYISVPPLAVDKSLARPGQAGLIRALGPNFHALDEISYAGWSRWVTANSSTWFQAGVTARQRMAGAGFDIAAGDTWALNELSSAVRKGTGAARQNALDFMRGLATGSGGAPLKGVVFVIGVGQSISDVTQYKVALQGWLQDASFWSSAGAYASDWAQENYGDVRNYAVAGASRQMRRDALNEYLGHELALANAGPDTVAAARSVLGGSYVALGNAAWAWGSAYGWTSVPFTTMEDFVAAQVYAGRAFAAAYNESVDRIGFAWAPKNTTGLPKSTFDAESADILGHLGQAIHDSAAPSTDPGSGACAAPPFCAAVLNGAAFTPAWKQFSTWTLPGVAFVTPPFALTAGSTSGSISIQLQTAGIVTPAATDQQVTLSSSSPQGQFSLSPAGPWTPSLTVTIPAGASTASFYYTDTHAGPVTLSAALPGQPAATQSETVTPAAPVGISVSPTAARVTAGKSASFSATGADTYGNVFPTPVTWSLSAAVGQLSSASGAATTFTAGPTAAVATLIATAGPLTATVQITVVAPPSPKVTAVQRFVRGHLVVTVTVRLASKPVAGILLDVRVRRGTSLVGHFGGRTGAAGRLVWRSKHKLPRGSYVVKVTVRSASTSARTMHASR